MTDYEKYKKEFDKEVYVSASAEFKRVIGKKVTETIFADVDSVFEYFLSKIVNGTDKKTVRNFFMGEKVKAPSVTFYFDKFEKNKVIQYSFKKQNIKGGNEFQIFKFTFTPTNKKFTKVSYSHSIKLPTTITGFNGKLGGIKFRSDIKKEARLAFAKAKEVLEKK